jgi:2-dehydropantoate 2-reductase
MRICIYGLGAIGGLVAARLARSGQHVSAVARGVTLDAVRREGLLLLERYGDTERRTRAEIEASERPGDLGEQDLVVLTVKTTGLAQVARDIGPLLGPRTAVLSMMNGLQWWFFHGLEHRPPGLRLESVDPGGAIAAAIAPERVIGSVTHLSSASPEPGVIRHGMAIGSSSANPRADSRRAARPRSTHCAVPVSRWRPRRASRARSGSSCGAT